MLRITFDANVWKLVASPQSFPQAGGIAALRAIRTAAMEQKFLPTMAETAFTLDAVKESWRQRFRGERPKGTGDISGQPDGTIAIKAESEPRPATHPASGPQVARYWDNALTLGFKLLRCPRLAIASSGELKSDWFIAASFDIVKRFDACSRGIESAGCGMRHLERVSAANPKARPPWQEAIAGASVQQATAITKAVAEWIDGDTVAAHYAYANDYICTTHTGGGGLQSILSTEMRESVLAKINIRFLTPEQLVETLARY